MFQKIKKRDGRIVNFQISKIAEAICKAGQATGEFDEKVAAKLADKVNEKAQEVITKKVPTVEELQDIVEDVLLASKYRTTAKAYIIYRQKHSEVRDIVEAKKVDIIDNYLDESNWLIKENANMAFSLQGLRNHAVSEVCKSYWLNKIYTPDIRNAHLEGDFHIHDLSELSTYCVGWDLQDLLRVGFKGVEGKIESKPAKHFRVALGQIVNYFYTLQGESAGAQAFSNFDTLLAPFIKYDGLTRKEIKQALQEFIFNMNVSTRVGFQTPFTNVTMDLTVPSTLANEPVLIGGETKKETYAEFQEEMYLFNDVFAEVVSEGDASGRVFTFPIPTYNITKEFDWENKHLDYFWKMTARYGIPYFSNYVNSDLKPEDARSMCCRLRLDNTELKKRGGALFGANPLTGSIGVVTINLPRLGYLAEDETDFYTRLNKLLDMAKESLETKRAVLEKFTDAGLYPYSSFYLRNVKARFKTYWENHFSTIGLVGLNEACENLYGYNISDVKGKAFANQVLEFMRGKIMDFQEETGHYYNLEATPAEGTSYRLARLDKKKFPKIKVANSESEKNLNLEPYYTNSSHLPVNYSDDIFEVLDHQDELQTKYTGGTVVHLFIGEAITNINSMKSLIRKICHTYELPYFTISPTFSVCQEHGYQAGEFHQCETCGADNEVYSRIVGYIRPIKQWNPGKRAEFTDRKTLKI